MIFSIPAAFAGSGAGLLPMRTRDGTATAGARVKVKGRQRRLSPRPQAGLTRIHATGDCVSAELMKVFSAVCRIPGRAPRQGDGRAAS